VLEGRIRADRCERDLRHHRRLGERARAHEVADRLAVAREARRPVREVALVLLVADGEAQVRPLVAAVNALAALRAEERDDVIARRHRRHVFADRLDDPGSLVAENRRRVAGGIGAGGRVQVGVADAARGEPHQNLTRAGIGEIDLGDVQRLAELLEDRGADLHRSHPPTIRSRSSREGKRRTLDSMSDERRNLSDRY
jgi:hypothetical protein